MTRIAPCSSGNIEYLHFYTSFLNTAFLCTGLISTSDMLHSSKLSLLQKISPIWVRICLWSCVLRPSSLFGSLSLWPFCWKPLRFELDIARCVVELLIVSHLMLQALRNIVDRCLFLSYWLPKQHELTVFVFLGLWLLYTRRLERKSYWL